VEENPPALDLVMETLGGFWVWDGAIFGMCFSIQERPKLFAASYLDETLGSKETQTPLKREDQVHRSMSPENDENKQVPDL
jgi:hypothetical protein